MIGGMDDYYPLVKTLHIISAAILFGTGLGTAFFMFCSKFAPDLHGKYFAVRTAVLADWLFTAPAVVIQPLTGAFLVYSGALRPDALWLHATYGLYLLAGACWIPVVWIQIRMRNMLAAALKDNTPLPPAYDKLFRVWFWLGWPAFGGLVIVFFLMVMKPV